VRGHLDVVKHLVELGANVHASDDYALRYACECGYLEIVKYLISKGADIHAKNHLSILWAVYGEQLEVVRYIIKLDGLEETLKIASKNQHLGVIRYINEKICLKDRMGD